MPASAKTREIAEQSLRRFFVTHSAVYYWTFTLESADVSKSEAERRFKPFEDMVHRRGGQYLAFWELQKRGAWHVHLVTDLRLDVNWLRPWMVERKWGPIMKVKFVQSPRRWVDGEGWVLDDRQSWGLVKYLCKYLTKSFRDSVERPLFFGKKKVFGGSSSAKIGTTRFSWSPYVTGKASGMLYFYGRQLYRELFGRLPRWAEMAFVVRLGFEAVNYEEIDPFWVPP